MALAFRPPVYPEDMPKVVHVEMPKTEEMVDLENTMDSIKEAEQEHGTKV